MTFLDWTHTPGPYTSISLDPTTKYEGNASLKHDSSYLDRSTSSRNNFSATQVRVVCWTKSQARYYVGVYCQSQIGHPSYGTLVLQSGIDIPWEKCRATFWYDASNNTKFGRVEKWDGTRWVQVGDDVNFGTGAPNPGTVVLVSDIVSGYGGSVWWDVVEVYTP